MHPVICALLYLYLMENALRKHPAGMKQFLAMIFLVLHGQFFAQPNPHPVTIATNRYRETVGMPIPYAEKMRSNLLVSRASMLDIVYDTVEYSGNERSKAGKWLVKIQSLLVQDALAKNEKDTLETELYIRYVTKYSEVSAGNSKWDADREEALRYLDYFMIMLWEKYTQTDKSFFLSRPLYREWYDVRMNNYEIEALLSAADVEPDPVRKIQLLENRSVVDNAFCSSIFNLRGCGRIQARIEELKKQNAQR